MEPAPLFEDAPIAAEAPLLRYGDYCARVLTKSFWKSRTHFLARPNFVKNVAAAGVDRRRGFAFID